MLLNRIINKLKLISITESFTVILNKKFLLFWSHGEETDKNFGDTINPILFSNITKNKVVNSSKIINIFNKPIYYFIGSILDNLNKNNAIICGTGFQNENAKVLKKPLKIIAVRGPLTRNNFIKQNIECPEIYCDPALLLPYIYMPKNIEKKYDVGIIPHYVDKQKYRQTEIVSHGISYCFIDIEDDWKKIINEICSCKSILSSSLHGIIAAHAYKIPAARLKLSDNIVGGNFKFDDYAMSLGNEKINTYNALDGNIELNKVINDMQLFDASNATNLFLFNFKKHFNIELNLNKGSNECL